MSKNVAVFVDVANIFYAAKAAGVDIDYVTLLKSATAGRDFVRAYAYTGLDPENENQRQFHGFLARSGYKVVSKDIRKYGDGRIKANLDIELVVDMMRMADKLDIAVVVSGDGDFAPAIYAVQQQGVRVEVISFRGNTSSDLIDAADVFIDIASVAKVEKGVRSGRRVAAEGDLSMTEVPDKESGVVPRRRRRDTEEKPERAERPSRRRGSRDVATRAPEAPTVEAEPAFVAGLVALPGERLSGRVAPVELPLEAPDEGVPGDAVATTATPDEASAEEGRRRRRRRGGRGRGRGTRDTEVTQTPPLDADADMSAYPDEVPILPQHSSFGSVWDSQIGVAPAGRPVSGPGPSQDEVFEEDLEAEPDVPEYLIAEKRQQDRRRGGRGGRSGGYRSAIDRERYGVGSRSGYQRGPGRAGPRSSRPSSPGRASVHAMEPIEQTPGGDPWSEVPPEVQELLRAELARRQGSSGRPAGGGDSPAKASSTEPAAAVAPEAPAEEAKPKRTTRRRSPAKASSAEAAAAVAPEAAEAPAEEAKPKRTTRRRSPAKASSAEPATTVAPKALAAGGSGRGGQAQAHDAPAQPRQGQQRRGGLGRWPPAAPRRR